MVQQNNRQPFTQMNTLASKTRELEGLNGRNGSHPPDIHRRARSTTSQSRLRWWLSAVTGFFALVAYSAPASAYFTFPANVGYILSTNPTGNYDGIDEDNSTNTANKPTYLTRFDTGYYQVDFDGLAEGGDVYGGDVQVNAWGSNAHCNTGGWWQTDDPYGGAISVTVFCFDQTGQPVDSLFTTSFFFRTDQPGPEAAYVWASNAASASYNAASDYAWNSTGGSITITHTPGTGSYAVKLGLQNGLLDFTPGPGGYKYSKGSAMVTAYGWQSNTYCNISSVTPPSYTRQYTIVNVACFNGATGAPTESQFDLNFSTMSPTYTPTTAFAWGNAPTSPSYNPDTNYVVEILNTGDGNDGPHYMGAAPTITRDGIGAYEVRFPDIMGPDFAYATVTAYGSGSDYCNIAGPWIAATSILPNDSHTDTIVKVNCFSYNGSPANAQYMVSFSDWAWIFS